MNEYRKLLWISSYAPYDTVGHAGGKIHNYYLKYLHQQNFQIRVVTICREEELEKLDMDQYGIQSNLIVLENKLSQKAVRYVGALNAEYNIWHKYAGRLVGYRERPMKRQLKKISEEGYKPDVILIEWTEMIVLIEEIKSWFPNTSIIAIEEDVSYLSYARLRDSSKNRLLKFIYGKRFQKLKSMELNALRQADLTILNNRKDQKLICKDGIEEKKTFVWCPYFENMLELDRKPSGGAVIFYGAMNRRENYLSAIWFIEKVMPLIEDLNITFEIIGGNPPKILKKYESERVLILGFVKDISVHFQKGLCLAAPLVLGAGVKIKVLEALSSGLPVLTNHIGIEGIYAKEGKDYLHCEKPEEYAEAIRKLVDGEVNGQEISQNAKEFIREQYNLEKSAGCLKEILGAFIRS